MIWNEKIECADRAFFDKLTIERLQDLVKRCYENVPFYKKALDNAGVKPEDIKTLADYQKVPFTVKTDLRDNYPYGLFAVPQRDIVRIHGSSGTTGKPIIVGYTKGDLDVWKECISRLIYMAGGSADDIAQICFGYGLFTGAFRAASRAGKRRCNSDSDVDGQHGKAAHDYEGFGDDAARCDAVLRNVYFRGNGGKGL